MDTSLVLLINIDSLIWFLGEAWPQECSRKREMQTKEQEREEKDESSTQRKT